MKKILLLLISLIAALDINAQLITVYKNGAFENAYRNTSTTTYKAAISGNSEQKIAIYKTDTTDPVATYTDTESNKYKVELSSGKLGDYEYVDLGVKVTEDGVEKTVYFAKINAGMENKEPSSADDYYAATDIEKGGCYFNQTNAIDENENGWRKKWNEGVTGDIKWCLPSEDEMKALIDNTHSEWTTSYNGARGYIFYKKLEDGHSYTTADTHIFLPAAGGFGEGGASMYYTRALQGAYWSCTVNRLLHYQYSSTPSDNKVPYIQTDTANTRELSVRPVFTR